MQPRKLKVAFGFAPYGGNGASSSEHPDIRNWLIPTILKMKEDERIDPDILYRDICDTPITMVRNELVGWAKEKGADVLVMVDSDNTPDVHLGQDKTAKPFFASSFDFLYKHYERGPVMIGAPYCGPPTQADGSGSENVYVFLWRNYNSVNPEQSLAIDAYQREEAARMAGIMPVAALPTGCIMFDLRVFDLVDEPYFYYEYKGAGLPCEHCGERTRGPERQKDSTEDVVTTRNISLNGQIKLGYNPVFVNWDAWAGHWKPRCVGKPTVIAADAVSETFKKAVLASSRSDRRVLNVSRNPRLPVHPSQKSGVPQVDVKTHTNGRHVEATIEVHPDDERMTQNIEGATAEGAFATAHNTPVQDISILKQMVREHAMRICQDSDAFMRIVELGSWVGHSAIAMSDAIKDLVDYEIHCMDHWKGGNAIQQKAATEHDAFNEFKKNVGPDRLSKTIIPHRDETHNSARTWSKREPDKRWIDFLFIDADHTYEGCKQDILDWMPFVRPGGVICGHDYIDMFPGVKRAVHETLGYDVAVSGSIWATMRAADENTNGQTETPELQHGRI